MELRGKVALVTGGSRGIGRATVLALAREGCQASFTYSKNDQAADGVLQELKKQGQVGAAHKGDVASLEMAERAVRSTVEKFDRLDILVNNAGILVPRRIDDLTEEIWDRTIAVNLKGMYNMCRSAIPHLRETRGRIVNVASIAGLMGGVAGIHYAASKAGVLGLTRALSAEVTADGVLVNSISPDAVDTELVGPDIREKVQNLNLLKRLLKPDEVAQAILFLARSDVLTGQNLNFNAGRYVL